MMIEKKERVTGLVRDLYNLDGKSPNEQTIKFVVQKLLMKPNLQNLNAYVEATRYLSEKGSATPGELKERVGSSPSQWSALSPYHRSVMVAARYIDGTRIVVIPIGSGQKVTAYITKMEELIGVLNEN